MYDGGQFSTRKLEVLRTVDPLFVDDVSDGSQVFYDWYFDRYFGKTRCYDYNNCVIPTEIMPQSIQ